MPQPLVSIIILTYNSEKHLPGLLRSLATQTYLPLQVIVVDSASQDNTVAWLEQQTTLKLDHLITNATNVWYDIGNNQGLARATGEYILFCNDDIMLEPNYIEKNIAVLEQDKTIGMVGGKLLKLTDGKKSTIIDSAALQLYRSRKVTNRGENERDGGQYNEAEPVFGVTGALMMVSRKAINAVQHNGQFFDEDYVAYKEDVDVSWRMHLAGFTVRYVPEAVAYHARSIQLTTLGQRELKPAIIRGYSYRNHLFTLIKNETWSDFWQDSLWIVSYEVSKFFYLLLKEPSTLKFFPEVFKKYKTMRAKHYQVANSQSIRKFL